MGNKKHKLKRKVAAQALRKTGGIPPVTLAVADPVAAFVQSIPAQPESKITVLRAFQKIIKDVSKNRPQRGPLKKVRLQPKKIILDRLTLRKDEEGRIIVDVVPGDPICTLDGKPFVRKNPKKEEEKDVGLTMEKFMASIGNAKE